MTHIPKESPEELRELADAFKRQGAVALLELTYDTDHNEAGKRIGKLREAIWQSLLIAASVKEEMNGAQTHIREALPDAEETKNDGSSSEGDVHVSASV